MPTGTDLSFGPPQGLPLLSRRDWLARAAAMALTGTATGMAGPGAWAAADGRQQPASWTLLTAWDADGQSWAGLWQPGRAPRGVALPQRAHEVLAVPGAPGQALAVARRPGEFLLRFDARRARPLQWHEMEPDRLLSGHAAYSPDARKLYTAEYDAETGAGWIVERDPRSLRPRREFASGGIGPHMVVFEPSGTMLVANGGLLTLPETGRRKLNRDSMDASLARIDPATGRQLGLWRVDDPYLSLRHLAMAPDGTVAVAMQAEHAQAADRRRAPLLALLDAGSQQLRTIALPDGVALEGYGGDVAWLPEPGPSSVAPAPSPTPAPAASGSFVVSATRAGQLAWWSPQGRWQGQRALPDAGALATASNGWLACGGGSAVLGELGHRSFAHAAPGEVRWDNHARFFG